MKVYVGRWAAVVVVGLMLTACGKSVEGTYQNEKDTIELKSGGKAVLTMAGKRTETTWEMNGKDKVTLKGSPEFGNMDLDVNSDGNLSLKMGMGSFVFKKK